MTTIAEALVTQNFATCWHKYFAVVWRRGKHRSVHMQTLSQVYRERAVTRHGPHSHRHILRYLPSTSIWAQLRLDRILQQEHGNTHKAYRLDKLRRRDACLRMNRDATRLSSLHLSIPTCTYSPTYEGVNHFVLKPSAHGFWHIYSFISTRGWWNCDSIDEVRV